MIAAAVAVLLTVSQSWTAVVLAADDSGNTPLGDPITFFIGQGVLGVVCFLLYREYRDEKQRREAQTEKLISEIVPMLTRATEALERAVAAETGRGDRR